MNVAQRIFVRLLEPSDEKAFIAAARRSRSIHGSWVDAPSSSAKFRELIARTSTETEACYVVCRRQTAELVGVIRISSIVRGRFCSGYLGYYVFAGSEGQGLMKEGLTALIRHAFRSLKLHRLEANIQPENSRSLGLVRACGFHKEGYSPKYLKIAGRWKDHERWAIVST